MSENREQEYALNQLELELEALVETPSGRRAFLRGMPLLLAACSTIPQTRHREGDNTGQETSITVADERRMTQEVLPKMVWPE